VATPEMDMEDSADIVIITALMKEREAVLRHLGSTEKIEIQNRVYYRGTIHNAQGHGSYCVVVLSLPDMGSVQAATATALAITVWSPRHVILAGITAGLENTGRNLGDILVSEQIIGYEPGKVIDGKTRRRYQVFRPTFDLIEAARNLPGEKWVNSAKKPRPSGSSSAVMPKVHFGDVASGDKIVADSSFVQELKSQWPQLAGIEMESYGAALAAHQTNPAPGILMVKGICDWADGNKNDDWQEYAADISAAFLIAFLEHAPFDTLKRRHTITGQLSPDPIISCILEYPIVVVESLPRINKANPDIIVYNDGAVGVVKLKLDLWILNFAKPIEKIVQGVRFCQSPHNHLFAIDKFDPSGTERRSVVGVHGSQVIGIYVADLAYYREVDWKEYRTRHIFFVENDFIYTERDFRHRAEYTAISKGIDKFIIDSEAQPHSWFRAVDSGWIVDLNPDQGAILQENGNVTVLQKFHDIEKLKSFWASERRPFLTVKPVKFTTTNSFFERTVEGGKNIVKVQFEVLNDSGETAANVAQEDEAFLSPSAEKISIPAGCKQYIHQLTIFTPVSAEGHSVPNTSEPTLDLDTLSFVVKKALLYSGTGSDRYEYRTAVTCEFKKETVELILTEFE
jgi:nucleoside phosphorylase